MTTLSAIALTLAVQLLLGSAFYASVACLVSRPPLRRGRARRRRQLSWTEASRALVPAVVAGLVLLALTLAVAWFRDSPAEPASRGLWVPSWPFLVLGSPAGASCFLILHAGWRESRGDLRAARRLARLGGFWMLLGIFSLLVWVWSDLLFRVPFRRAVLHDSSSAALQLLAGMFGLGMAAFVGLVAGLSGKPRPSGYFAVVLYLGGLLALLGTVRLAAG